MMLLSLALAAQTVALEADPRAAAITCSAAIAVTTGDRTIDDWAIKIYFSMEAARYDDGPSTYFDKFAATGALGMERVATLGDTPEAYIPLCRARYPKAWVSDRVTLPANSFQSRLTCGTIAAMIQGLGSRLPDQRAWLDGMFDRFSRLISNEDSVANGFTGRDRAMAMAADAAIATLEQGNSYAVLRTCDATYPA